MMNDSHNSVSKSNVSPVCRSSLVNERQEDKTALQVAAHEGHTQVSDVMCKWVEPQYLKFCCFG